MFSISSCISHNSYDQFAPCASSSSAHTRTLVWKKKFQQNSHISVQSIGSRLHHQQSVHTCQYTTHAHIYTKQMTTRYAHAWYTYPWSRALDSFLRETNDLGIRNRRQQICPNRSSGVSGEKRTARKVRSLLCD